LRCRWWRFEDSDQMCPEQRVIDEFQCLAALRARGLGSIICPKQLD
jgi:hypothetical protein